MKGGPTKTEQRLMKMARQRLKMSDNRRKQKDKLMKEANQAIGSMIGSTFGESGKSISDADMARLQEFLGSMTSPRRKTDRQLMQFEKGGKVKKPKTLNKGGGLNAAINRVKKEQGMKKGGAAFPDLTGDGKVTQKDILKGRGVDLKQEGGAVRGMGRAYMGAPRKVKIR